MSLILIYEPTSHLLPISSKTITPNLFLHKLSHKMHKLSVVSRLRLIIFLNTSLTNNAFRH